MVMAYIFLSCPHFVIFVFQVMQTNHCAGNGFWMTTDTVGTIDLPDNLNHVIAEDHFGSLYNPWLE